MSHSSPRVAELSVSRPLALCARYPGHLGRSVWLAIACLALALATAQARPVFGSLQTSVVFPGHVTQGQPSAMVDPRPGTELVKLSTTDGEQIVALFGPALTPQGEPDPRAAARPTMLFFYGNGECLNNTLGQFQHFRELGLNVLVPDYVGYGMSTGPPSEVGCYATADAAYEHLVKRRDVDPHKIVIAGWSLGAAVAVDLAARKPSSGLATFSAFTNLVEMSRHAFPLLPAKLLVRYRFDSVTKIGKVSCPILIGHGRRDLLIPYKMSDRLAAAAGGPVTRVCIENAGHGDLFLVGEETIDEALVKLLAEIEARPAR